MVKEDMMRFLGVIFNSFCLLVILAGCSLFDKEQSAPREVVNEEGVVIEKSPIWRVNLYEDIKENVGSFLSPILHDNLVITPSSESDLDGSWALWALTIDEGKKVWEWEEPNNYWWLNQLRGSGKVSNLWIEKEYNGYNADNFYAIDLNSGETVWSQNRPGSWAGDVFVYGDKYYYAQFPMEAPYYGRYCAVYEGDVYSTDHEIYLVPETDSIRLSPNNHLGFVDNPLVFEGEDAVQYMLIPFSEYQLEPGTEFPTHYGNLYMALYDMDAKEYVYSKALVATEVQALVDEVPMIYEDRLILFNIRDEVIAFDLYTGDVVWQNHYDQGAFSMILVNSVLVMSQQLGDETYAYGLDPETGQQLWVRPSGGGASDMQELNGVVYWKDRGDASLYAVDGLTGELIWRLGDPDPESESWWKSDGVAVLPGENGEKGRVFASSHLRFYCFEAAR